MIAGESDKQLMRLNRRDKDVTLESLRSAMHEVVEREENDADDTSDDDDGSDEVEEDSGAVVVKDAEEFKSKDEASDEIDVRSCESAALKSDSGRLVS